MEGLYLGHAGILIRDGDTYVAVDPFLSGSFEWRKKINSYQGNSPWIGNVGLNNFVEEYAEKLKAILITHEHTDHFDIPTIREILTKNPTVAVYLPKKLIRPLKKTMKKNSISEMNLVPIMLNHQYVLNKGESQLLMSAILNHGSKAEKFPYRVGFLLKTSGLETPVVFITGDSHGMGEWLPEIEHMTDLITWGIKGMLRDIPKLQEITDLQKIWWIHWEEFHPGNFHCSQNIQDVIKSFSNLGFQQEILSYNEWMKF